MTTYTLHELSIITMLFSLGLMIIVFIKIIFDKTPSRKSTEDSKPKELNEQITMEESLAFDSYLYKKLDTIMLEFLYIKVIPILIENKIISAENQIKLNDKFFEFLELRLTNIDKNIIKRFMTFDQFKTVVRTFSSKKYYVLNLFMSSKKNDILTNYIGDDFRFYEILKEVSTGVSENSAFSSGIKLDDLLKQIK